MTQTHVPIDRSLSAMEQWERLPEGIHGEVINGELFILSFPSPYHQRIAEGIHFHLRHHVIVNQLGETFGMNVGVFLNEDTFVVSPDLLFISRDNMAITIDHRGIHGAPDFHLEVLSPTNRRHDLIRKKDLYEHAGVKEYWIIDPTTKNAHGYLLKDGKYGAPLLLTSSIHIRILEKLIEF
jgi:Uma2 family endonuclease